MRKMMRKSDSKHSQETPEEELKRLRKEVARLEGKLEAQNQAANAKIVAAKAKMDEMRKELKKKEEPKPVFSKEQWSRILTRLKDIDTQSK